MHLSSQVFQMCNECKQILHFGEQNFFVHPLSIYLSEILMRRKNILSRGSVAKIADPHAYASHQLISGAFHLNPMVYIINDWGHAMVAYTDNYFRLKYSKEFFECTKIRFIVMKKSMTPVPPNQPITSFLWTQAYFIGMYPIFSSSAWLGEFSYNDWISINQTCLLRWIRTGPTLLIMMYSLYLSSIVFWS